MSSPAQSSGTSNPNHLFEDLWRQLRESHQNALKELEEKVSKLKRERYLDAQSLEVFHIRTQQLKDQNKTLQEAIIRLEERLCAGECERCASLEENVKHSQDQNTKLKNERDSAIEENRKLHAELQNLKMSRSEPEQAEQEEGIIPDSPILPSSLPVANKLKKRKDLNKRKYFRYAEVPLPKSNNSLFSVLDKEPVEATKNPANVQVLVPNTCELDASQISNYENLEEPIAETCGLDLIDKPCRNTERSSSKPPRRYDFSLKPSHASTSSTLVHSPDSTTKKSPSIIPSAKRFSQDGSISKAKRKKEENMPEVQEEDVQGIHEGDQQQPKQSPKVFSFRSSKWLQDSEVQSPQNGTSDPRPSPTFKKPKDKRQGNKDGVEKKGNHRQGASASRYQHEGKDAEQGVKVEPMWSVDPALALSMYDSELRGDEEEEEDEGHGEVEDSDRTWVSHSLLQSRGNKAVDRKHSVSGLGEKANDSLDMMFDTTTYGEYKSFSNSHPRQSQQCDDVGGDDDDDYDDEEDHDEQDPDENTLGESYRHKARGPAFAHVAVVRKKDERRKLKGATCKECDIYYAHLPEEEKQKKLSACSRHRFLYIPPCTPENFWEVGFPSTQTCIERGYINEEKSPQARTRRRLPFKSLFSPKQGQQES